MEGPAETLESALAPHLYLVTFQRRSPLHSRQLIEHGPELANGFNGVCKLIEVHRLDDVGVRSQAIVFLDVWSLAGRRLPCIEVFYIIILHNG